MVRAPIAAVVVVAASSAAASAGAQTAPIVTVDDYRSKAEITAAISVQGPPDVNMRPDCERLSLPCGSGKEFPDFGLALSVAVYTGAVIGIVGELSRYSNDWLQYATSCPYRMGPPQCSITETNHVSSALVGVKVRSRLLKVAGLNGPPTHGRLFFQMLAGPQWSDVSSHQHILQPAAGFDHYLRSGATLHVEAGYRFAPRSQRDLSTPRIMFGIEIPVG